MAAVCIVVSDLGGLCSGIYAVLMKCGAAAYAIVAASMLCHHVEALQYVFSYFVSPASVNA